ncbi:MAG: sugar ABC transporter permease [Oscillospiraceae bacterium]|jgi:multiple sugar transport system permease protein|nr:sugar ABC transporter permease [Oscillospiraceae bacterium]
MRQRRGLRRRGDADNLAAYLFLTPWLLGFLVLTLYPMAQSLFYSFTRFDILTPPQMIGAANYVEMFTKDKTYIKSLEVTFSYVFLSVPFKLVFALLVAVLMNQRLRLISFYRTVYYIPTLLGGSVAIAVLWKKLFSGDGVINSIISALFGVKPPAWIAHPKYAMYTLVLLTVWQFGSSMIIFLAGLKQIPGEHYEAAAMDGAGKVKQFFHITIPALSPVILFNLVMQTISAFQAFTQAFIISNGQGGPLDSTMFYTLYLYLEGFHHWEMGYASAMAWVLLIIIAVFTALIFKTSGAWVDYGSGE